MYRESSQVFSSSGSDSVFDSLDQKSEILLEDSSTSHQTKSDRLSRLYEKKKLKEKLLSKKLRTPFVRKLNRSCWPIQLSKVSKIKKKPKEKKKGKPHYKSLRKKNISNPKLFSAVHTGRVCGCGSESDEPFEEAMKNFNPNHFLHEPVTPQMLIDILQTPEHLKSGATLDMIITKLRALKLDLNPTIEMLKEEVREKLRCAIKLGVIIERNGFYTVVNQFRLGKLPRKKVDAFWDLWKRQLFKLI